ncbi:MAG: hypothetical protein ACTSR8_12570 [Promethearchaeota archaeon]
MSKNKEELDLKEIVKLQDQILKVENNLKKLEQAHIAEKKEISQKFEEKLKFLDNKIQNDIENKITELDTTLNKNLDDKIKDITSKINLIKEELTHHKEEIKALLKNQEDILLSIVNKFKDEFKKNKVTMEANIEKIREEQDTLKISFTVNENRLLDIIQNRIKEELQNSVRGKEREILMKIWIEELRKMVSDFEQLKKMNPKEFELQINEIVEIIESFKDKLKR